MQPMRIQILLGAPDFDLALGHELDEPLETVGDVIPEEAGELGFALEVSVEAAPDDDRIGDGELPPHDESAPGVKCNTVLSGAWQMLFWQSMKVPSAPRKVPLLKKTYEPLERKLRRDTGI